MGLALRKSSICMASLLTLFVFCALISAFGGDQSLSELQTKDPRYCQIVGWTDTSVVLVTGVQDSAHVVAFDTDSHRLLWQRRVPGIGGCSWRVCPDGTLCAVEKDLLLRIDVRSGRELWRRDVSVDLNRDAADIPKEMHSPSGSSSARGGRFRDVVCLARHVMVFDVAYRVDGVTRVTDESWSIFDGMSGRRVSRGRGHLVAATTNAAIISCDGGLRVVRSANEVLSFPSATLGTDWSSLSGGFVSSFADVTLGDRCMFTIVGGGNKAICIYNSSQNSALRIQPQEGRLPSEKISMALYGEYVATASFKDGVCVYDLAGGLVMSARPWSSERGTVAFVEGAPRSSEILLLLKTFNSNRMVVSLVSVDISTKKAKVFSLLQQPIMSFAVARRRAGSNLVLLASGAREDKVGADTLAVSAIDLRDGKSLWTVNLQIDQSGILSSERGHPESAD